MSVMVRVVGAGVVVAGGVVVAAVVAGGVVAAGVVWAGVVVTGGGDVVVSFAWSQPKRLIISIMLISSSGIAFNSLFFTLYSVLFQVCFGHGNTADKALCLHRDLLFRENVFPGHRPPVEKEAKIETKK
jgi:hypothetical protein